MSRRAVARFAVVLVAAATALLPMPPALIERWYSNGVYPRLQTHLTTASNGVGFALFDVLVAIVTAVAIVSIVRRIRQRRTTGIGFAVVTAVSDLAVLTAMVYLAFLACWGLNYRRVPLERKVDYVESRITLDAARDLARASVQQLNELHSAAHGDASGNRPLDAAFQAGADGFIPKDSGVAELRGAIEEVLAGRRYASAKVPRQGHRGGCSTPMGFLLLTPRQREIVRMIARGMTSEQMAGVLGVSQHTIHFHRKNLRRLLGIRSDLEMFRYAILVGIEEEHEGDPARPL